jgi:hypothetical protein
LFCFREGHLVFRKMIYWCNNDTLFVTFGITVNTFVCMCGIFVPGHTCDEYLVLV